MTTIHDMHVASLATFIFFTVTGSNAETRGPCTDLHTMTVLFRTGSNDLHTSSVVTVWLMTKDREFELEHIQGGFPPESKIKRSLTLRNPHAVVNSCDIMGVRVNMVSHPVNNEDPDIWSMNGFAIHGYTATRRYAYFLAAAGNPLKRFTRRSTWWEMRDEENLTRRLLLSCRHPI